MGDLKRLEATANILQDHIESCVENDSGEDIGNAVQGLTVVEKQITERERLRVEEKKAEMEFEQSRIKAELEAKKLEIERIKAENEAPEEKTFFGKLLDFGKSWGGVIAGGLALTGVIVHEVVNRKNLSDVTEFEETGTYKTTAFRKYVK